MHAEYIDLQGQAFRPWSSAAGGLFSPEAPQSGTRLHNWGRGKNSTVGKAQKLEELQ